MNKKTWLLIAIVSAIWICLFPIVVFSEDTPVQTYDIINNECYVLTTSHRTGEDSGHILVSGEVRAVSLLKASTYSIYIVTDDPDVKYKWSSDSSSACLSTATTALTYDSNTGYYYKRVVGVGTSYYDPTIPIVEANDNYSNAIYYTYGEGAVGPEEVPDPINWGILRDVQFETAIAGQGLASKRNVDYLLWQNVNDANGNDISECSVEVQAVLGRFYANSASDLLEKTLNDFDIGSYNAVNLGTVPATQGKYSISWQRVLDLAGWSFDSIYSHIEDSVFLKTGWYYQIRLVAPDGYIGSWQTLYTPLASSAKASETVINQNSYSMDIYQVYEYITQINNQTSITVNFDGTEYTIQNPDDGTDPSEPYDYFDILKYILNGLIQIKGSIEKLPKLFMENVQSLITPPQSYDGSLAQQFDQAYESYIQENQPTIYDFLEGAEELQPYINGLAPSDQGIHTCIIRWDAVTLDLSIFNAGTVTFIQAGQHNLTETLLSFLHAFNLSYADYKLFVSAVIYLWLLAFIWRHFIRFLEKD